MEADGRAEPSRQEEWRRHDAAVLQRRQRGQRWFLIGFILVIIGGTLNVWWGPFEILTVAGLLIMPVGLWRLLRAGKTSEEAKLALNARRGGGA